ncbi:hypothetical protein PSHT_05076 [Puccinia striiformis]|uniref:Uncharacterized protein n=1 Tax=Puccinia striiformis TaxID=27350 RepID=A0A2S4WBF1_9BASI|nr:hypothetical protein PSHT_05076 [Puccinia striiformis]
MVAIRHPTNNNINHFLRALPWPIFQMRTYALIGFLVQIWVIGEAFPMYQDEEDTGPFSPIQTEKMGANMFN